MEDEKDMQEKTYLQKFNNLLVKYDEADAKLNAEKEKISDADYIRIKGDIDSKRNATIERMEYERNTYNMMTTEEDKENYYNYDRIISGDFNNNDYGHTTTRFSDIRYSFTYSEQFNKFFTNNKNEIVDNRTIEMGEPLYNSIMNVCDINNVNLDELGIKKNGANYTFIIPKNEKAFVQFSDIYFQAMDNTFLHGAFINTANKFFNDKYKAQAGDILNMIGLDIKERRDKRIEVEDKYGINRYYLPIMRQYSDDITVQAMRMAGYNDWEINNQRDLCLEAIKDLDLTSTELYVCEDDIKTGGQNPLTRCTDPKIKQNITNDIYRSIGEIKVDDGKKYGTMQMSFATVGDKSGTLMTIPKIGENSFYKVFIPDALPSRLKETFDSNPQFVYSAKIDMWDAQARENVPHRIAIGNAFTGNIYAKGNGIYEFNNGENSKFISKTDAIEIQYGADMLRYRALNRNMAPKEILGQYDNETVNVIDGGLAQTISNITNTPIEKVRRDLIKYYTEYYSK